MVAILRGLVVEVPSVSPAPDNAHGHGPHHDKGKRDNRQGGQQIPTEQQILHHTSSHARTSTSPARSRSPPPRSDVSARRTPPVTVWRRNSTGAQRPRASVGVHQGMRSKQQYHVCQGMPTPFHSRRAPRGARTYRPLREAASAYESRVWLGGRDSNPDSMDQNHVSYHWTTAQYRILILAKSLWEFNRTGRPAAAFRAWRRRGRAHSAGPHSSPGSGHDTAAETRTE